MKLLQVALTHAQVRELIAALDYNMEHYRSCIDCGLSGSRARLRTVLAAKGRLQQALAEGSK